MYIGGLIKYVFVVDVCVIKSNAIAMRTQISYRNQTFSGSFGIDDIVPTGIDHRPILPAPLP